MIINHSIMLVFLYLPLFKTLSLLQNMLNKESESPHVSHESQMTVKSQLCQMSHKQGSFPEAHWMWSIVKKLQLSQNNALSNTYWK